MRTGIAIAIEQLAGAIASGITGIMDSIVMKIDSKYCGKST